MERCTLSLGKSVYGDIEILFPANRV